MKTSIPSDVWEKKKALIARLYKDEEWPLKQVIKQIRTDDFNPSETQLRSRLKKWRVTKPSRQIRKKTIGDHGENVDDDEDEDGLDETSPLGMRNDNTSEINNNKNNITPPATAAAMALPTPPQSQHSHQSDNLAITRDWYPPDVWLQSQQDQYQISPPQSMAVTQAESIRTQAWAASMSAPSPVTTITASEQLTPHGTVSQVNTPVVTQYSTRNLPAYDHLQQQTSQHPQSQSSTHQSLSAGNISLSQTSQVMSHDYMSPTYNLNAVTYPQPAPSSATHWPTGSDYIEPDPDPGAAMAVQSGNWVPSWYDVNASVSPSAAAYYQRAVGSVAAAAAYNTVQQQQQQQQQQNQQHMPSPQEMDGQSYQLPAHAHAHASSQTQSMTALGYRYDDGVSVRPWRRATASHFTPEYVPGVVRVDRQGRQRKPFSDRKIKEADLDGLLASQPQQRQRQQRQQQQQQQDDQREQQEQNQSQPVQQLMYHTYQPEYQQLHQQSHQQQYPQYIAAGHSHHTMMPHEVYTPAGHEQLLQRSFGH